MLNFGGGNNIILVAMDTLGGAMDILGGEASHALRQPAALLRFRPLEDWPTWAPGGGEGGLMLAVLGAVLIQDGKDMVGPFFLNGWQRC